MNVLRDLRKQNKKKQKEVAQDLGISRDILAIYECGSRNPGKQRLQEFAKYYGVSVDYLLGIEKPKFDVSSMEQRLIEKYRRLTATHRAQIESNIDFLLAEEEATKKAGLFA